MEFTDLAVKAAVEKLLGETYAREQLEDVEMLTVSGAKTLEDLSRLPNLRWLKLSACTLDCAQTLGTLTQLQTLWLTDVHGVESRDLAQLIGLEELHVTNCGSWPLEPLGNLTGLKQLTLDGLQIRDISPLKALTGLEYLSLKNDPVTDAAPMLGMKALKYLYIDPTALKNRDVLLEEHLSNALDERFWPVFPGSKPYPEEKTEKRAAKKPKVKYLANVHPRVHFCRDAALVKLTGGMARLVCRDYGMDRREEDYDLYLDGVPLVETSIPGCGTCATRLRVGYGDGLMKEKDCLAVRDALNEGFEGLKQAVPELAPMIGLMDSGMYLVADFDLFPVFNEGNPEHFWNVPDYSTQLHFVHAYPYAGAESELLDAPLYLAPSQRASAMDPERVEYYRQRLREEERFPRAVAMYLSGGVALLLDGHHKAAACAAEGVPVKTLVIFPVERSQELEQACMDGRRLYLHHTKFVSEHSRGSGPLHIRDAEGIRLAGLSCLEDMKKTPVYARFPKEIPWGTVNDAFLTEKSKCFPKFSLLEHGTRLPPDQIRTLITGEMAKARGTHDRNALAALQAYAELFPEGKWLKASERAWLNRSWLEFEFEDVTVLPPDR